LGHNSLPEFDSKAASENKAIFSKIKSFVEDMKELSGKVKNYLLSRIEKLFGKETQRTSPNVI